MLVPTKPSYYRLKIKSLKYISAVDAGAQGPIANVALIKRAPGGSSVEATCRVVKTDEKLGLVFGWALASTLTGGATPHIDLQDDAVVGDDELIKVAADFVDAGAASDVLHDEQPDGKVVFVMPLTKDVNAALGIKSDVHGLAIAMRPSPATFKRFVNKELNAFSIGGIGERELVVKAERCGTCGGAKAIKAAEKCADCNKAYSADGKCPGCGKMKSAKSVWSTADIDALPDSSFLYIESGGTKDEDGKTTPRSLRHFPYKDAAGKVDLPHLRNAISRIPQSSLPKDKRDALQVKAERLLADQHDKASKRLRKQAVLTSTVDGHAHTIDLDDPCDEWRDQLSTSYQTSEGATQSHCHAWTFDPDTGEITIADDSGHTHTTDAVVPDDVRAEAAANEDGERCRNCNAMCDESDRYCPCCGKPMGGMPAAAACEPVSDGGDKSGPTVVVVNARAPKCTSCGVAKGNGFAAGDRINVPPDKAHMPDASGPGTVTVVDGNALGITFDRNPSEVHRWYTLDEVEDLDGGAMSKGVCRACRAAKSSPSSAANSVSDTQEPNQMPDANDRIRELEAANARLEKMSTLTDAQRAHFAKLKTRGLESEAQAFLALTPTQRNTALDEITKNDPVVYVGKSNGKEYRQSDALEIIEAAKALDSMTELQKRLETERSDLEFSKRADAVLPNFAKGAKGNLRPRLLKAVSKEFTDAAEYAEAERAMKAADFALAQSLSGPRGVNPHVDASTDTTPKAQLDALAKRLATEKNIPVAKAMDVVLSTAEGAALYAQIPTARA